MARLGYLFLPTGDRLASLLWPKPPLHIRFTRAEPYFADEHIFDPPWMGGGRATDDKCLRADRGCDGFKIQAPCAHVIRDGVLFLAAEFDRDRFAGLCRPPNRNDRFTLQNHVITKRAGDLDVGPHFSDDSGNQHEESDGGSKLRGEAGPNASVEEMNMHVRPKA